MVLNKLKYIVYFFITILISFLIYGCAVKKEDTLIVGLQPGYPPYESIDAQGNVIGFDVDVAHAIAKRLHKKLVIREMGFDALILALKMHKIDLIMSGMSITPSRLQEIDMISYHGQAVSYLQLAFWNHDPIPFEQLKGKKIAVQTGTFQEQVLRCRGGVQVQSFEGTQELVLNIKYHKSDAALVEPSIGHELKYKYPEISLIEVPLNPDEQVMGNGIGIAKDRPELIDGVKKVIQEMNDSGELKALDEKWFHA